MDEHKEGPPAPPESEAEGQTYSGHAVRGFAWTVGQTIASKGLMIITQVILAQLLLPSDWGLAGYAVSIAAVLTVLGPLPLTDLLTQRGPHLAKAIPNAIKLCAVTAIFTSVLIAISSLVMSNRAGHSLETNSGTPISVETPLDEIKAAPSLPALIAQTTTEFQIYVDEKWFAVALPHIQEEATLLGSYIQDFQAEFDKAIGQQLVEVNLNVSRARLQVVARDGSPVFIRSWSSATGSVFDTVGISYRSIPLLGLLLILALVPFCMAFRAPWDALLRLRMQFGYIAGVNFTATVGSNLVAILIAILGAGGAALLTTHVVVPIIAGILMFAIARRLPMAPKSEREKMRSLVSDSSALWLAQWVHTAAISAPLLILGLFVSAEEVGFFVFATMMSVQVITTIAFNLGQAFTPIFSTLQEEPERLARAYLRTAGSISTITIPLLLFFAAVAPVFVPMIFGMNWIPAVPIVTILMLSQAFASTNPTSSWLLKGSGKFRVWLLWQVTQAVLFVAALIIVAWFGNTIAVAWTVFAEYAIFSPIAVYLCVRGYARKREVLRVHGTPFVASIPFLVVGFISYMLGPSWLGLFIWCPISLITAGAIYVLLIRLIDKTRYQEFVEIIEGVLRKFKQRTGKSEAA